MGISKQVIATVLLFQIMPSYSHSDNDSTLSQTTRSEYNQSYPATPSIESEKHSFFEPYNALYSTVYKKGITLKVEGTQTLTQTTDNTWKFEFSVDTLLASLKESSQFRLDGSSLRPTEYQYSSRILGKHKEMLLHFDWDDMKVTNDVKNEPWKMDINDLTLDRLTLQLQLRFDLLNQREQLSYDIADGGKLKRYTFAQQQIETIDTKLGHLETIKVARTDNLSEKRHSYFWFAPEYDYLLVKMEHFEKGESYILNLEKISSP